MATSDLTQSTVSTDPLQSTVTDAGSDLATEGMWATNQHAGNRPSDNSAALTAPGSPSPSVDAGDEAPQPFVQPAPASPRHLLTTDGGKRTYDKMTGRA